MSVTETEAHENGSGTVVGGVVGAAWKPEDVPVGTASDGTTAYEHRVEADDERPHRKVAMIGYTTSREQAPFDDAAWEVWGMNNLHKKPDIAAKLDKFARWYDLHDLSKILVEGDALYDPEHHAWLQQPHPFPVYVFDPMEGISETPDGEPLPPLAERLGYPSVVPYPKLQILSQFMSYFTNTVSWQIAHLLYEGLHAEDYILSDMGLYGIDMAVGCLAPETRVLTADLRWVTHEQVRVGDNLVAFDESPPERGKPRRFRTATVEAVRHHIQPCYRIHFADGTKIVASTDHPWLVNSSNTRRWLTTELLEPESVKDRPSQVVKLVDPWDEDRSWGAGYLAAALDGEGHCSGCAIGFSQRDNAMAAEFQVEARRRGFGFAPYRNSAGGNNYVLAGGKRALLRLLGEVRPRRLLDGFMPEQLGSFEWQGPNRMRVVEVEYIGDHATIGLQVDTGTYIAEGFATHNTEYAKERPSVEFFLGLAMGLGVEIDLPQSSDLLKALELYGGEDTNAGFRARVTTRLRELHQQKNQIEEQVGQMQSAHASLCGAIDSFAYVEGVWLPPAPGADAREKVVAPSALSGVGQFLAEGDKRDREGKATNAVDVAES